MKIASYKGTKAIIEKYDFVFKKSFGQNFLIDNHVLEKIIAAPDLSKDDVVIEIGPGIGGLTEELSKLSHKVIAVEIDKNLIPILEDTLSDCDNVEIINQDILKLNINELIDLYKDKNIKVVANLPYYITTPIIMEFLENKYKIKSMTVMIQKEVASRISACPGTKSYGAISLGVQYYSKPYLVANVPRNSFIPRPNVDSSVIRLDIFEETPIKVSDEKLMFKLIKIAFSQRRKNLVNCIFNSNEFNLTKDEIKEMLLDMGLNPEIRGEVLTLSDFSRLTESFIKRGILYNAG